MKPDTAPVIYSFIIRFVVEDVPQAEGEESVYHGSIRHIQSAEELNFNVWGEAVAFMRRYVSIEASNNPKPQP